MDNKDKRNRTITYTLVAIVALALTLVIFWMLIQKNEKIEVESSIYTYNVSSPDKLMVEYRVKNTSNVAGKSSCSITMSNESGSVKGSDYGYESAKIIQPGEEYSGMASVQIPNQSADQITKGGISCSIQ